MAWMERAKEAWDRRVERCLEALETWGNDPERGEKVLLRLEARAKEVLRKRQRWAFRAARVDFPRWVEPSLGEIDQRWLAAMPRENEPAMAWAARFARTLEQALAPAPFERPRPSSNLASQALAAMAWSEWGADPRRHDWRWRNVAARSLPAQSMELAASACPDLLRPSGRRALWLQGSSQAWPSARQFWLPWTQRLGGVDSPSPPEPSPPRLSPPKPSLLGWAAMSLWVGALAVPAVGLGFCATLTDCALWRGRAKKAARAGRSRARQAASAAGQLALAEQSRGWGQSLVGDQGLREMVHEAARLAEVSVFEESPQAAVFELCGWALAWLGPRERACASMAWFAGACWGAGQRVWRLGDPREFGGPGAAGGEDQAWASRPSLRPRLLLAALRPPGIASSESARVAALAALASPWLGALTPEAEWSTWRALAQAAHPGSDFEACAALCESASPEQALLAYQAWARGRPNKATGEPFRPDGERAHVSAALARNPGWPRPVDASLDPALERCLRGDAVALAGARAATERLALGDGLAAAPSKAKARSVGRL